METNQLLVPMLRTRVKTTQSYTELRLDYLILCRKCTIPRMLCIGVAYFVVDGGMYFGQEELVADLSQNRQRIAELLGVPSLAE